MKMQVVITGTYEIPDDPDERMDSYGTVDLEECIKSDMTMDWQDVIEACDDVEMEIKLA